MYFLLAWLVLATLFKNSSADNIKRIIDDVDFLASVEPGYPLLDNRGNDVRLYYKNGTFDTLMTTKRKVDSVDFHFTKKLLFAYTDDKIVKTNLDPKLSSGATPSNSSDPVEVVKVSFLDGFAVDWVHARVYWAAPRAIMCCGDHHIMMGTAIMSCGLDGAAEATVMTAQQQVKWLERMVIDPYKGILFWTTRRGILQSVDTSGENFKPNLTNESMSLSKDIALDLQSQRIYFIWRPNMTYMSHALYSIDYTGGDLVEHLSDQRLWGVFGLGVVGDKVFWAKYAMNRYEIYEAYLNHTKVEDVKMLLTVDRAVSHMKVVHPSLQTRPEARTANTPV